MAKAHARKVPAISPDEELIARAEAAVAALSSQFAGWMEAECNRLKAVCRQLEAGRPTGPLVNELFKVAHDIKGEAATFGFPVMERIATSLCRLINEAHDRARVPRRLVERHVAAMLEALSIDREADRLAHEIELDTAQFLADDKRIADAPRIASPPLAP